MSTWFRMQLARTLLLFSALAELCLLAAQLVCLLVQVTVLVLSACWMAVSMSVRYPCLFWFKTGAIGLDMLATATEGLLVCLALLWSYCQMCISKQDVISVCSKMSNKENAWDFWGYVTGVMLALYVLKVCGELLVKLMAPLQKWKGCEEGLYIHSPVSWKLRRFKQQETEPKWNLNKQGNLNYSQREMFVPEQSGA